MKWEHEWQAKQDTAPSRKLFHSFVKGEEEWRQNDISISRAAQKTFHVMFSGKKLIIKTEWFLSTDTANLGLIT